MLIRHGQISDAGIMIRHIVVDKEMLIQGFSKLWMTSKYCHLRILLRLLCRQPIVMQDTVALVLDFWDYRKSANKSRGSY